MNTITLSAAVIGSGCAGFNAADSLFDLGVTNIALITEGVNMGTSRNTGSDKQTYYKLSLSGDQPDSVYELAHTLKQGGAHGDIALCEAAGSTRAFMKLVHLGVHFPENQYGEFVGYKTDHDPRRRATSAGPLTSKRMTEALERAVKRKNIRIFDGYTVTKILTDAHGVCGLYALNRDQTPLIVHTRNVILATGGPAMIYHHSVYPESQTGATGLAIDCGAALENLSEWQYGLASIAFRWNLSGSYQQVLPRYVSVDENGVECEFLYDYYDNPADALNHVFLKGYQWPFDSAKVEGSSRIDMLVYREIFDKGNRVFLDYRAEPEYIREHGFNGISGEAVDYLRRSNALCDTPIARLSALNPQSIALYASHGIDLWRQPLEISLCAQHHNGGVAVDEHWRTNIRGLYVCGEAAGTFNLTRPGGSALNSTQVGSYRAAQHIREQGTGHREQEIGEIEYSPPVYTGDADPNHIRAEFSREMSRVAACVRDVGAMEELVERAVEMLCNYNQIIRPGDDIAAYKTRDMLLTQRAVLSAMIFAAKECGSRGGSIASDHPNKNAHVGEVIETRGEVSRFIPARGIPKGEDWFENVWAQYVKRTRTCL